MGYASGETQQAESHAPKLDYRESEPTYDIFPSRPLICVDWMTMFWMHWMKIFMVR